MASHLSLCFVALFFIDRRIGGIIEMKSLSLTRNLQWSLGAVFSFPASRPCDRPNDRPLKEKNDGAIDDVRMTLRGKNRVRSESCVSSTREGSLAIVQARHKQLPRSTSHDPSRVNRRDEIAESFVEHHLTIAQLADIFIDSYINVERPERSDGLSSEEAKRRLGDGGRNAIEPPKETRANRFKALFLGHFPLKFWLLLLGATILSFLMYGVQLAHGIEDPLNLYCAIILLLVIIAMSGVSYWQETSIRKKFEAWTNLISVRAAVIRDGQEQLIPFEEVVVGDIVAIRAGYRIPADMRMLKAKSLRVDTSQFKGLFDKVVECRSECAKPAQSIFDARNVVFKGSFCTEGEGIGIVLKTGKFTVMGRMAQLQDVVSPVESKLQKELRDFANIITIVAVGMATIVFVIGGLFTGFDNIFYHFVIGFLVVIVANGLPATVMIQLGINSRRLATNNVYIKKLDIIDELGATSVICCDKTGTLTMNKMIVTDLWYNNRLVSGSQHRRKCGSKRAVAASPLEKPLPDVLTVMSVCNGAEFDCSRGKRRVATQRALDREASEASLLGKRTKNFAVKSCPNSSSVTSLKWNKDTKSFGVVESKAPQPAVSPLAGGLLKPPCSLPERAPWEKASVRELPSMEERRRQGKDPSVKPRLEDVVLVGSPCDVALARYVGLYAEIQNIRDRYQVVHEVAFNSARRWHLVVARCIAEESLQEEGQDGLPLPAEDESRFVVMMKGAAEFVIDRCQSIQIDGEPPRPFDDALKQNTQTAWESLGNEGRRVIAFAHRSFNAHVATQFTDDASAHWAEAGLVFLGMAAIMDPPRPETAGAVSQCKKAGIKIYMVTGDHPTTAKALAQQIGLITDEPPPIQEIGPSPESRMPTTTFKRNWKVVTGSELEGYGKEQWDELLDHPYIVFARTNSDQKLAIVRECQAREETVAVTGGGVNDAPAIAQANVGIAMGQSGSDMARQTADVILLDNSFAALVLGIREGRLLFDNLRATLAYTFAHLWPEVVPVMMSFLLGIPLGLSPLQILSIDLACEMPPSISLAYEPPDPDIMSRPPRERKTKASEYLLSGEFSLLTVAFPRSPWLRVRVRGNGNHRRMHRCLLGCVLVRTPWRRGRLPLFGYHGVQPSDLLYTADHYWKIGAANMTTSTGKVLHDSQQVMARGQAASAWQITLVMSQVFHLHHCTSRRVSVFRHPPPNMVAMFAILIEILLLIAFCYTYAFHYVMDIRSPPFFVWLAGPAVGVYLLVMNELRKWAIRAHPTSRFARMLKW